MTSSTHNASANSLQLTTTEDWDRFRRAEKCRLPQSCETILDFLERVKGWKFHDDNSRFEEYAASAAKMALRTCSKNLKKWQRLQFNTRSRGGCPCSDLRAFSHQWAWPTLRKFQEAAEGGCERCWFITQSVASHQARFAGIDPGRIYITLSNMSPQNRYLGDFPMAVVRWLADGSAPTFAPYIPQPPELWRKLPLVLFADKGSRMDSNIGRMKPPPPRSDHVLCLNNIKKWINECVREHTCGLDMSERGPPTRLVDVCPHGRPNDIRLVVGAEIGEELVQFAALSHCWGDKKDRIKPVPKTKINTLQQHKIRIEWSDLTPTFQDTIVLVRLLGLKYVWIDALCIVQDDPDDFAREAARMAVIYSQAHLVIAATRSSTGDAGLFHERPTARLLTRNNTHPQKKSCLYVKEEVAHLPFLTNDPFHFNSTPLLSRAWCFQERLLGKRVIHFSAEEIVFECENLLKCECGQMRMPKNELGTFKMKTLKLLKKAVNPKSRILLWYNVMVPYTACALHNEKDRLPALSGFAGLIASPELGDYYAGLWRYELPSGLLWRVVRAAPGDTQTHRHKKYCGPSWSWTGVRARIETYIKWHQALDVLTEVLDVKTILTSDEDRFGAVEEAFIELRGPAIHVILQQDASEYVQERECFMSLADGVSIFGDSSTSTNRGLNLNGLYGEALNPPIRQSFQLDVPTEVDGQRALCVAIQQWSPEINYGQGMCLVLQELTSKGIYTRLGFSYCPALWLQVAQQINFKII